MLENNLHIYNCKSIIQYKLIEEILKIYNYNDYRNFIIDFKIDLLDNNKIAIINKKNNEKKIYVFNDNNNVIQITDTL